MSKPSTRSSSDTYNRTEWDFSESSACKQQEGLKEASNGSDQFLTFQGLLDFYCVLQKE